jgi:hypothetical protein
MLQATKASGAPKAHKGQKTAHIPEIRALFESRLAAPEQAPWNTNVARGLLVAMPRRKHGT